MTGDMRRHLAVLTLAAVVSVTVAACGGSHASSPPTTARAAVSPSWEAVLTGRTSQMERVGGRDVLVVGGLRPAITLFTDRPRRLIGDLRLREFLALWRGGAFSADPPNAAVVTDGETVGVELAGAELDPAAGSIRFTIDALPSVGSSKVGPSLTRGPHGETAMFIDALPTPVNGQITDSASEPDVRVVDDAPTPAMGDLYQALARSVGLDPRQALSAK
jgi:Killing trait